MGFICEKCNHEFPQTPAGKDKWLNHRSGCDGTPPVEVKPKPKKVAKEKVEMPVLTYKYEGECDKCRNPVDTLVVDVSGKVNVIAYCQTCKRQVVYRPVAKL